MSDPIHNQHDRNAMLLEGLLRMAVDNQQDSHAFRQLNDEVYAGLARTYENATIGSAKVQLRGQQVNFN